jgi:adenylylsulfate kinase
MNNITWHHATVTRARRELLNGHKAVNLWFTGLSGAGKSTIAHAVEEALHAHGCRTIVLDGDNVRHGLCSDLGFGEDDRRENIRRVGETVKLFLEGGAIVLTAFISPFRADRQRVRDLMGGGDFVEVHVRCSINECERRDVKGLYKRARAGEIPNFTGISSPYEEPEAPELVLESGRHGIDACVTQVLDYLVARGYLRATGKPSALAAQGTLSHAPAPL